MSGYLTSWHQETTARILCVPQVGQEDNLASDLDAALSSTAQVTINGVDISRDMIMEQCRLRRAASIHIDLVWNNVIEVPQSAEGECTNQGGIVAGQLVITQSLKTRLQGAPAQNQTIAVYQAYIGEDSKVASGDRRRIFKLSEVVIHQQVPVTLGPLHQAS